MSSKFHGTGVAIATPYTDDNKVDLNGLENLTKHLISNGVDYIVPLGTTGETYSLTKEEKQDIVKVILDTANGAVPIMVGIGGNSTHSVAKDIENYDFTGIDAFLSICPYYNKPRQEGIFLHYQALASVTDIPMMIYNVPSRTGVNMERETTIKISKEIPSVFGIKEANPDGSQCAAILKYKREDFIVVSGDDHMILPFLSMGAAGVISVLSNAFPAEVVEMQKSFLAGNVERARHICISLMHITDLLFREGSPSGIKACLNILGIMPDNSRLPMIPVTLETYKALEAEIELLKQSGI